MKFYKDHYQVIIIGGALAGMSAALQLQAKGVKDILILEKHNLPGGLATDFVRNGIEIEATLHEMMSIGKKGERLKVGQFFDDMGVNIDWLPVPECYRVVLPNSGLDVTLHDGYERMAREINAAVPGTFEKVHELMLLCRRVYDSMNVLSVTPMSKVQMLLKHPDFVKTVGYSATEVIETFHLPKKAVELLTPYWIYVGSPMDKLPFTIYAFLMADYFTGSHVCRYFSHEMSMRMQQKVEENGAHIVSLSVIPDENSTNLTVMVKLDTANVAPVVQSLERHGYSVEYSRFHSQKEESDLQRNYNNLMVYLNV